MTSFNNLAMVDNEFFFLCKPENPSALVLDVKCGKAAFATTEEKARALAHSLVSTCHGLGIKAVALITSMDAPLGRTIGNSVEIAESISCLNGKGPEDLKELVCEEGKNHLSEPRLCKTSPQSLICQLMF